MNKEIYYIIKSVNASGEVGYFYSGYLTNYVPSTNSNIEIAKRFSDLEDAEEAKNVYKNYVRDSKVSIVKVTTTFEEI